MASSAAVAGTATSSEDEDFLYETAHVGARRYPVHDCCEFEDAESLRVSFTDVLGVTSWHATAVRSSWWALHF